MLCGVVVADASTLGGMTSAKLAATRFTGAPAVTVHGCDNFTGTNGATLVGRAATVAAACNGRTWTVPTGSWVIQTNAAQSTGIIVVGLGSGLAVMNTTAGSSVTVRAAVPATGLGLLSAAAGVVASYTNASTYLRATIVKGILGGTLSDFVQLYYGSTQLVSVSYQIVAGSTPQLRLNRSGATVSVRVDNTVMITHTLTGPQSAALTGGAAGIYFFGDNGIRVDDFAVTGYDP